MDTCESHFAKGASADDLLHPVVLDHILLLPLVDVVVVLDAEDVIDGYLAAETACSGVHTHWLHVVLHQSSLGTLLPIPLLILLLLLVILHLLLNNGLIGLMVDIQFLDTLLGSLAFMQRGWLDLGGGTLGAHGVELLHVGEVADVLAVGVVFLETHYLLTLRPDVHVESGQHDIGVVLEFLLQTVYLGLDHVLVVGGLFAETLVGLDGLRGPLGVVDLGVVGLDVLGLAALRVSGHQVLVHGVHHVALDPVLHVLFDTGSFHCLLFIIYKGVISYHI